MVEIKGIGEHTIKEKTSFHQLLGLLNSAEAHIQTGNYPLADSNLQVIDNIFPEEKKSEEYKSDMTIIKENWKKIETYYMDHIQKSNRYLEMRDAQETLQIQYALQVRNKFEVIESLFIKNKYFEEEPREYEA